jgi:hypothetical protein
MNQHPSDDSANVPPSSQAVVVGAAAVEETHPAERLNPILQQALSCLNIKLEDELTRFRSSAGDRSPSQPSVPVSAAIWTQPAGELGSDPNIFTAEILQQISPQPIIEADDRHNFDFSDVEATPTGGFIIIDGLITATTTNRNAITTVNYAQIASQREAVSTHENLDLNFSSGGAIAPFHDEYLSSSQELLRQIQSGYPAAADATNTQAQTAPPQPRPKLLTPLKFGSIAAACVLAGGVVYTALNPNILAPLIATKTIAPTATTNSLGQLIQSPNLAATEFTEITLSNINNIKLPTAAAPAPATNVSMATTPTINATATAPVAIPFNGTSAQVVPSTTITAQPRLADSLVKSLLPPNFRAYKPGNLPRISR